MSVISKVIPTGTPNGKSLKVVATVAGSADTFHTADASATDEVWLYALNNDTQNRELTVLIDGQETTVVGVPFKQGLMLVIPGLPVSGAKTIKVFAEVTDKIYVSGWVNRIS